MAESLERAWSTRDARRFERLGISGGRASAIAAAAEELSGRVHDHGVVLDVGCGVGLLARVLNNRTVVGLDYSESLLPEAAAYGPVARASLFALPIAARGCPAVACLFVLDDYEPSIKETALRVLASVVAPGGELVVGAYAPDDERMGTRRAEFSSMTNPVYLEDEQYYENALSRVGEPTSVWVRHVLCDGDVDGITVRRHLLVAGVTVN